MRKYLLLFFLSLIVNYLSSQPSIQMPDTEVTPGETICIPLTAKDFTDILTMRFTLYWNEDKLAFQHINSLHAEFADASFYQINDVVNGKIIFDWFTNASDGLTLPDHESIFEVCFLVTGSCLDYAALRIGSVPQPIEVFRKNTPNQSIGLHGHDPGWVGICTPNDCRVRDSLALVAIHNSMYGGVEPKVWKLEQPMDTWRGVELNNDRCVSSLILNTTHSYSEDIAKIPIEIGNLEQIDLLAIFNLRLQDTIPKEIGQLFQLETLYIYSFRKLKGNIPREFGQLFNLKSLNLSENDLSGTIPSELGQLSDLSSLNLSCNQLTGIIPTELEYLSNLRELNLSHNQLEGEIPTGVVQLNKIGKFYLQDNNLGSCLPEQIINYCHLGYSENGFQDGYNLTGNPLLPWQGDLSHFCNGEQQIGSPCVNEAISNTGHVIDENCNCVEGLVSPRIRFTTSPAGCFSESGSVWVHPIDGAGEVVAEPTTNGYTIQWADGVQTFERHDLLTDIYDVTVTYPSGAVVTNSIQLRSVPSLEVNIETEFGTCSGAVGGIVRAIPMPRSNNEYFDFELYSENSQSVISSTNQKQFEAEQLPAGDYRLTIADDNGCLFIENISFGEDRDIILDDLFVSNPSCSEINIGNIELTVKAIGYTVTEWEFNWFEVQTDGSEVAISSENSGNRTIIDELSPALYRVRVTDDNPIGCDQHFEIDLRTCDCDGNMIVYCNQEHDIMIDDSQLESLTLSFASLAKIEYDTYAGCELEILCLPSSDSGFPTIIGTDRITIPCSYFNQRTRYRISVNDNACWGYFTISTPENFTCNTTALAVELIDFNVQQVADNIHLNWEVQTASNLTHYNVQRATGGQNWQAIGKQIHNKVGRYEFIDTESQVQSTTPRLYYRLAVVDHDGLVTYSPIESILRNTETLPITFFPNPTSSNITVDITNINTEATLEIYHLNGQRVLQQTIKGATDLDLSYLSRGVYLVRVHMAEGTVNRRIILK